MGIYQMTLGEVGFYDFYDEGNDENHSTVLWILFVISSFILIIHMLNMLIAIMSATFEDNQATQPATILKTKLRFVIDNFKLVDPFGDEKVKIAYIVSA